MKEWPKGSWEFGEFSLDDCVEGTIYEDEKNHQYYRKENGKWNKITGKKMPLLLKSRTFISCSVLIICTIFISFALNKIAHRIHEHSVLTATFYDECVEESKKDIDKVYIYNGNEVDCSK